MALVGDWGNGPPGLGSGGLGVWGSRAWGQSSDAWVFYFCLLLGFLGFLYLTQRGYFCPKWVFWVFLPIFLDF
jgi:hypothetical protein